jgi:5'(3')-deoxyribonucleotidase
MTEQVFKKIIDKDGCEVHVFTDNDGVQAGFEAGFKQKFGRSFYDVPVGMAWGLIGKDPHFFRDLPFMPGFHEYWEVIGAYHPTILTGCPSAKHDVHKAAKHAWLELNREHFHTTTEMIVCLTKDKPLHMKRSGDILIDDHEKNGVAWTAAGGRFILFKNAKQAIEDFQKMVTEIEAEAKATQEVEQ